jgi:hypothetical protein
MLGQASIPARVIDRDECGCLEMSLVENVARCNHAPIELLRDGPKLATVRIRRRRRSQTDSERAKPTLKRHSTKKNHSAAH